MVRIKWEEKTNESNTKMGTRRQTEEGELIKKSIVDRRWFGVKGHSFARVHIHYCTCHNAACSIPK